MSPVIECPISNIHLRQGYGGQAEYPTEERNASYVNEEEQHR
jgi:hypothetical protein